ncbi:DUF2993 domain-containing protein [Streptomyces sp. NPDC057638]|uniref:LmeA family phospholipid-binding protein n=1 Tax=Streptomyces sp. NPDC057638 TaxID=3346190 RepID=UPI003687A9E8
MRVLRKLLITAIVLGGLFIAADRIAVHFAESEAAERVRSSQGLRVTPKLSIEGFPFLTQVAAKRLDKVKVNISGITASAGERNIGISEVKAELRDVRISGDFSSAVAATASGSAEIAYADLTQAAPEGMSVAWAGAERAAKNQVKITGTLAKVVEGAGIPVPSTLAALVGDREISVHSSVELVSGNTVRLKADALPDLPIPGIDAKLREIVDYELKLDGVPPSITMRELTITESGLRFSGTAQDVRL